MTTLVSVLAAVATVNLAAAPAAAVVWRRHVRRDRVRDAALRAAREAVRNSRELAHFRQVAEFMPELREWGGLRLDVGSEER